jgi:hypothetical protein
MLVATFLFETPTEGAKVKADADPQRRARAAATFIFLPF